jgi:transketolase
MAEIVDALDLVDEVHGRPAVIIARTTKGKGVDFMENSPVWHGGVPNEAQFQSALAQLEKGAALWQA